jgi:hypothetical protein
MNTIFVIKDGQVETQEPVEYWNILRQQAQDSLDELGGDLYTRSAAQQYLDESWRPDTQVYSYDTGETDTAAIPDDLWIDYTRNLLDEIEKGLAQNLNVSNF